MGEIIIGSPDQRMMWVGSEGQIGVSGTVNINNITGSIVIGSVSASVDSVYIQSGDNVNLGSNWKGVGSVYHAGGTLSVAQKSPPWEFIGSVYQSTEPWLVHGSVIQQEAAPTDSALQNFALELIYSGTVIGSVIKHTTAGSYIQVLTYTGNNLTNVGSFV